MAMIIPRQSIRREVRRAAVSQGRLLPVGANDRSADGQVSGRARRARLAAPRRAVHYAQAAARKLDIFISSCQLLQRAAPETGAQLAGGALARCMRLPAQANSACRIALALHKLNCSCDKRKLYYLPGQQVRPSAGPSVWRRPRARR